MDEALRAYNNAVSIKPDYYEAFNNIGNILKSQKKLDEAIEAFRKAISIQPGCDAYYNVGNALKEQDKLGEASKLITRPSQSILSMLMPVATQRQLTS